MAIGEAGGPAEHRQGLAFVGPSGRFLDQCLLRQGLTRDMVRVTNVYPYWTGEGNPTPTAKQIAGARELLDAELRATRPRVVLLLGATATRHFLGDVALAVVHGVPHARDGRLLVPSYHPAAALHDPTMASLVAYDVQQWALVASGKLEVPVLAPEAGEYHLDEDYTGITAPYVSIDTEGTLDEPWGISVSASNAAGEPWRWACVVRWPHCKGFQVRAEVVVLHNAMYDLPMLDKMGVELKVARVEDTMVAAYNLRVEPQGLKELARRHLGMEMREYHDVVGPWWQAAALDYLDGLVARAGEIPRPEPVLRKDKSTGKWRVYQARGIAGLVKRAVADFHKGREVDLAERWRNFPPKDREQAETLLGRFPRKTLFHVPDKITTRYSAMDADATIRLRPLLAGRLRAAGLEKIYETDCAALPMLARMQIVGMGVDPRHFEAMRGPIHDEISRQDRSIFERWNGGKPFSLDSGEQVAEFVYGKLRLPPPLLTGSRERGSVNKVALDLLEGRHPAVGAIKARRQLATQVSFVERLPKHIGADGRIHPSIRTTSTDTGRLSTSDPNLQGIPVRTELGKRLRRGFVAGKGKTLYSSDLSQIELRVIAHLSRDRRMCQAFRDAADLHAQTAQSLGIDRALAKTINFGILYGAREHKIHATLLQSGTPRSLDDCRRIVEGWFELYSGVHEFFDANLSDARRHGFARSPLSGRIRYLPHLYSPDVWLRAEAERQANNFPVQEGAQYIMKRGMANVWRWMQARQHRLEPLLQIHDELLMEGPIDAGGYAEIEKDVVSRLVYDEYGFEVPLVASFSAARTWGDLEK
jgi:uracil-DNA glycosylase family 4